MSEILHAQFIQAEEKSLELLSQGPEALETFYEFWSKLQSSLQKAIEQETINEETLVVAHRVATRIEIISARLFELFEKADCLTSSLQNDLDAIFADLHIDGQSLSSLHSSSYAASDTSASLPPYIQPAFTWLLQNLHNPYPSKDAKRRFSREAGSSLKDIESWFINVRKRIGWNKLRMKHYENKRSKIVDAATRYFRPCTTCISGIDSTDHCSEFKSIENRAKALYSKLDAVGGDLIPETKERCQVAKQYRKGKDLQRLSAYPSPERSQSPELSQTSSPIPNATETRSRKRRRSDCGSPELDVEDRHNEPQKRGRMGCYPIPRDLAVASLPSPATSLSDIPRESCANPPNQAPLESDCVILPTTLPSGKHKRRLSDAGHDGPSKRPHNALAVPRLQTVSDPLPLANPASELYGIMFGQTISDTIPGPVSVESLDDTQVEVDFYNYNTSPDIMQSFLLADSSLGPYPAAPSLLSAANSEPLSLEKSQDSDSTLDFLFDNYLNTPLATDIPFFSDGPSHDHFTMFPFENVSPTQPPQEDILSDPYFEIPGLWDFQGNDDTFSIVVPSIGTLFSSNPIPPHVDSTQNEKEAKRKRIEALRAQLQNLEAEP